MASEHAVRNCTKTTYQGRPYSHQTKKDFHVHFLTSWDKWTLQLFRPSFQQKLKTESADREQEGVDRTTIPKGEMAIIYLSCIKCTIFVK